MQDAEDAFAARDYGAVIRHLEWIERGSANADQKVLERALRLRYRAHLASNNTPQALADLDLLLERLTPDDRALAMRRIAVLIRAGEHDTALRQAETLLGKVPSHAWLLELAGQASQGAHQAKLDEVLGDLQRKLSRDTYDEVQRALLAHLFASSDSASSRRGREEFDRLLKKYREQEYVVRRYDADLEAIRADIARTRGYFERAMETDRPAQAAFAGMAAILQNAGDHDELIALGETYLRRFPDRGASAAATYIARLHYAAGRHRACVDVTERFLPDGTWRAGLENKRFGSEIRELLLLRARALHALEDTAGVGAVADQLDAMGKAGLTIDPHRLLVRALHKERAGDAAEVDRLLERYLRYSRARRATLGAEDTYVEAARMRLAAMRKIRADRDRIDALFTAWIAALPGDQEPFLERARLSIEAGHGSRALADAGRAFELASRDEETLRVYAQAADLASESTNRDSRTLLRQCLRTDTTLPRAVALDALFLALARRAIQQGHPRIALAASRRAAQVYTWSRQPRMLWAIAALRLDRPQEAIEALELLTDRDPSDREAVTMLYRAQREAGRSGDDLLLQIAELGDPHPPVARAILEGALERWDSSTGLRVAASALRLFADDESVVLAAGRTLAAFGNGKRAREVLAPLLASDDPTLRVPAAITCLLSEARDGAGSELAIDEFAEQLAEADIDELVDTARSLQRLGRPRLALDVLQPVLDSPRHADDRDGEHHLLAGTLCLELGEQSAAERHFTAALTFESGEGASRPLTLQLLRAGRDAEAADTYWDDRVEDQVGACLAIRFGKPSRAYEWLKEALSRNPSDVAAIFLRHQPGVGFERLAPIADVVKIVEADNELLLDVLTLTAAPGFTEDGLEKASALREKHPNNPFARFLHCRALSAHDKPQQALDELVDLAHEYSHFTAAYDEIVRILEYHSPREPLDPDIKRGIFDSGFVRKSWSSPRLQTQAARDLAARFMLEAGNQDSALTVLSHVWCQYPVESGVGAGELDLLLRQNRHTEVATILDALEETWPNKRRAHYLRLFGSYATRLALAGADANVLAVLDKRARELFASDGANGALLHYLLLRHEAEHGPLPTVGMRTSERQQLWIDRLRQHVRLFEEGIDNNLPDLLLTLRRVEMLEGSAPVLALIDGLLRTDLSLLPVWRLRAEILERSGDTAQAMRTLAWLPRYFDHPDLLPAAARLANQIGHPDARALTIAVEQLPATTKRTQHARLALGLGALRNADFNRAIDQLEGAAERADGSRQFYLATALLARDDRATLARAKAALDQLVARHPNSSLARMAGHLSRQLALEVNASSTPTKR